MGDKSWISSVLFCIGVILTREGVNGDFNNETYNVHVGFTVNTVDNTSHARSTRECAALCTEKSGLCQSATYNTGTKECLLSTNGETDITDLSDPSYKTVTLQTGAGFAGPSYIGTEFYTGVLLNIMTSIPVFWFLSNGPTTVNVVIPFLAIDETFTVDGSLTKTYSGTLEHTVDGEFSNKSIYISSLDPITVYKCNDVSGSIDATLVLPMQGIGQNYLIQSTPNTDPSYLNMFLVTGTKDGTQVDVNLSGTVTTHTLNRMDTLFHYLNGVNGATVTSSAPVSVQAGNECLWNPANTGACDFVLEVLPPEESFGTTFVVPYMHPRTDYTTGLIASAANTEILIMDKASNLLETIVLNRGQVAYRDYFGSLQTVITSNNPILVTQYGHGGETTVVYGDPSMMAIPPMEKYAERYDVYIPAETLVVVAMVVDNELSIRFNGATVPSFTKKETISTPTGQMKAAYTEPAAGPIQITHVDGLPFSVFVYGGHSNGEFAYSAGWLK